MWWLLGTVIFVAGLAFFAGLFVGVGPLKSLGLVTSSMQPVAYRPTTSPVVLQIAIALPPEGLCKKDEIIVRAFERGPRVEVTATLTKSRNSSCEPTGIAGDRVWVDVQLDGALGERTVVRESDRTAIPRETSANLG